MQKNTLVFSILSLMGYLLLSAQTGFATRDGGYDITPNLWAKAVLQPPAGPVGLAWKKVGSDTTPSGDRVISGYFYADPADFAYGSEFNPEVFVKVYIAAGGWCNIAFNHVTVDNVSISSAVNYHGSADQLGTASLTSRLVEHQYNLQPFSCTRLPGETTSHSDGIVFQAGNYTFKEVCTLGVYTVPSIQTQDLDNDGDIDLILASNENGSIVQLYENVGNALFRNSGNKFSFQSTDERHWNFGIAIGDYNGNSLPDIATADAWAGLNIYFNKGDLCFTFSQNYTFEGMGEVKGIAAAELNHDGKIDIVLGDHNGESRGDRILFNNGSGYMVDSGQSISWDITWDVFAIDINRDNAIDYISINRYALEPSKIHFNNGAGQFTTSIDIPDALDDSYDIKCFADGDYTYCFIANSEGENKRENRKLIFDKAGSLIVNEGFGAIGCETKDICLADLNSDGTLDVIAGNHNGYSVAYFSKLIPGGTPYLNFDENTALFDIQRTTAIGCADFNGDGLLDFIVGANPDAGETKCQYRLLIQQIKR